MMGTAAGTRKAAQVASASSRKAGLNGRGRPKRGSGALRRGEELDAARVGAVLGVTSAQAIVIVLVIGLMTFSLVLFRLYRVAGSAPGGAGPPGLRGIISLRGELGRLTNRDPLWAERPPAPVAEVEAAAPPSGLAGTAGSASYRAAADAALLAEPARSAPPPPAPPPPAPPEPPVAAVAVAPPLRPADPATTTTAPCVWEEHPGRYLGELAEDGAVMEFDLDAAKRKCEALPSCRGVTCSGGRDRQCSARLGIPYLADSPSGEVSHTRRCAPAAEAPTTLRLRMPSEPLQRRPLGAGRAAVVVIAHNRPDCLRRCLESLANLRETEVFSIIVSLDDPGSFAKMEDVARSFGSRLPIGIWRKSIVTSGATVAKISDHFKFALGEAFDREGYEYAVFLENDLMVSPDFLWYFRATAWLLEEDPTLFCVSAWNDNGISPLVADETKLFRTSYFPGLGWMIRNSTWPHLRRVWPTFPSTGWDHWLRHGSGLRSPDCVVPEVPRTHHFDDHGTNVRKGTALEKRLASMLQAQVPPGQLGDLSYLLEGRYEQEMQSMVARATLIAEYQLDALHLGQVYLLPYVRESYANLAARLNLSPAQPRTEWRGIIMTRHPGSRATLLLVDRRKGGRWLPEAERWDPHPNRKVGRARPGQSCTDFCAQSQMQCRERELEFVNTCEALQREFPCEAGCGHQVGQEIPAYVHDRGRDTALQCLMTDDVLPSCGASCPATTRLCVCVLL